VAPIETEVKVTELSDLQKDMLGELVNMGLGSAAASLSEMTGEEVLLSTPQVSFIPRQELCSKLRVELGEELSSVSRVYAVER